MEFFNKIENVNKEDKNTIKNFSPNYIKKESELIIKFKKTSFLSNNIQLKSLNLNYSKQYNNSINNEQIKKSTNILRKRINSYNKVKKSKNINYKYKPKKKLKKVYLLILII